MSKNTTDGFGWRAFLGHVTGFCVVILFAGLLVGATMGMRPLERRAMQLSPQEAMEVTLRWPSIAGRAGATWLPKADQESLVQLAESAAVDHPDRFGPEGPEAVSRALGGSGWYDGLPRVRRTGPHSMVVEGEWRVPAAVVRWEGKDHLISWDAKKMPPVYEADSARLPVILGSTTAPPTGGADEGVWSGEGVGAALELIETVAAQPWAKCVKGVDVGGYAANGVLALVTVDGTRVVWGGRPRKPRLGEVTTEQKLVHLAQVYHDHKRIDAGYPLIYVNTQRVQFDLSASAAGAVTPARP